MKIFDGKKPPIVRLPPRSNFEIMLQRSAQTAMVFCGFVVFAIALYLARFVLVPVTLAVVMGLMLGPVASRLERRGIMSWISSALVFLLFIAVLCVLVVALTGPLAFWWGELPRIWAQLQEQMGELRAPLEALRGLQDEMREMTGESGMTVSVEGSSAIDTLTTLAPAMVAQIILFMASLYFFVATRHSIRLSVLKLCVGRRLRWRVAHIFRDVETMVSRYLLSIALINLGLGICVTVALWVAGVPSPALWGALAGLFNFIMYIGPAIMAVILFAIGLATFDTISASLMPPLVYLTINFIEAQFVTPMVLGRTLTLNPFIVLLALTFWIWIWGPVGGFIAIPAVLIVIAIARNIFPGFAGQGHALPLK